MNTEAETAVIGRQVIQAAKKAEAQANQTY